MDLRDEQSVGLKFSLYQRATHIIEANHAHSVTSLEAMSAEAADELSNKRSSLIGREATPRVIAVNVQLLPVRVLPYHCVTRIDCSYWLVLIVSLTVIECP